MGNRFIFSDHHFGHDKIIEMENRPFSSVEEMDEYMADQWNSVVRPHDHVVHLGDLFMNKKSLRKLNGNITLIIGNHDRFVKTLLVEGYVNKVRDAMIYPDGGGFMVSHKPETLYNMFHVSVSVHGHLHSIPIDKRHFPGAEHINVCVDQIGYRPMPWDELVPLVAEANRRAEPCYRIQMGLDIQDRTPSEDYSGPSI